MFRNLVCILLYPSSLTSFSTCCAMINSAQASTSFSQEQHNITLPLSLPAHYLGNVQKPALHSHVHLEACGTTLTNGRKKLMDKHFPLPSSSLQYRITRLLRRYHKLNQSVAHGICQLNNGSLYWLFLLVCFVYSEPLIQFSELIFSSKLLLSKALHSMELWAPKVALGTKPSVWDFRS